MSALFPDTHPKMEALQNEPGKLDLDYSRK